MQDKDAGDKRGGTPEPNRRRDTRTGSITSQTSRSNLEESYSAADQRDIKKQDALAALTQNFCPVTLTVNVFFKQVRFFPTVERSVPCTASPRSIFTDGCSKYCCKQLCALPSSFRLPTLNKC